MIHKYKRLVHYYKEEALKYMKLTLQHYEILSLISGFLITFVFGSLYTLGTITPYIASYIHYEDDPSIYAVDVSILYPTYMVSQVFGIVLSMYFFSYERNFLQKIIGFKLLCFMGVYGMVICVFVTSFFKSYAAFIFFYGVLFGFLVGFCYLIPVLNCYEYLPHKKGLCSGICMMAFGLGSLLFNFILLDMINPEDKEQDKDHLFPIDVAENVPKALRYISVVYFSIGTIGCLLMIPKSTLKLEENTLNEERNLEESLISENSDEIEPKNSELENNEETDNNGKESEKETDYQADKTDSSRLIFKNEEQTELTTTVNFSTPFTDLLKTPEYKYLFVMILTSIPFGAFVAFNYKEYGETLTEDDELITIIGSLGALSNSVSRVFWCWLFDKYSWKKIMLILNSTQIIYVVLIIFVKNAYFYIFLVIMIYFSYGANYGMYPTQTVRIYGNVDGSRIYPITFSAFSIASVLQFLFHYFIVKKMGDKGFLLCFIIFGILLLIAEFLLITVNFRYKKTESSQSIVTNDGKEEKL